MSIKEGFASEHFQGKKKIEKKRKKKKSTWTKLDRGISEQRGDIFRMLII